MNGPGRFGIGLIAGLLLAVAIGQLGDDNQAVTTTTAVTTTSAPPPVIVPWFEENEVLIGETVILPRELTVEDGVAFFDYDLVGLGPSLGNGDDDPEEGVGEHLTMPERWELTTTGGATIEETTGPFDTSVSFDMPDGDAGVRSIRLIGWRIAVPFGETVEVPLRSGETATTRTGSVVIETVLEQSVSTIVQFDFDENDHEWGFSSFPLPTDPRWRTSGRQEGGLQLIWEGADAPDTVTLQDGGFEMRPMTGDLVVVDGGEL